MLHHLKCLLDRLLEYLDPPILARDHLQVVLDLGIVERAHIDPFLFESVDLVCVPIELFAQLLQVLFLHFLHLMPHENVLLLLLLELVLEFDFVVDEFGNGRVDVFNGLFDCLVVLVLLVGLPVHR